MNYNTTMPDKLTPYYKNELTMYRAEWVNGNLNKSWNHLERAHILGQKYPLEHSYVHWEMLKFGFRIKSVQEILGQIPRLIFGGVKSFVGKIPIGNPGGANVPPLKAFPIDKELQAIFHQAGV